MSKKSTTGLQSDQATDERCIGRSEARIQGEFYVIEENDDKIVFGNRRCPFGDKMLDRPALCMMTSNVFGSIAAKNLGYAKVVLEETIALHDPVCRVVVYVKQTPEGEQVQGREYFQGL